jgi:hypothetical protein
MPPDSDDERKDLKLVKLTSSMASFTFLSSYLPGIPFNLA